MGQPPLGRHLRLQLRRDCCARCRSEAGLRSAAAVETVAAQKQSLADPVRQLAAADAGSRLGDEEQQVKGM